MHLTLHVALPRWNGVLINIDQCKMDGISNPGLKMAAIKVIMRRTQYIPDVVREDNDVEVTPRCAENLKLKTCECALDLLVIVSKKIVLLQIYNNKLFRRGRTLALSLSNLSPCFLFRGLVKKFKHRLQTGCHNLRHSCWFYTYMRVLLVIQ